MPCGELLFKVVNQYTPSMCTALGDTMSRRGSSSNNRYRRFSFARSRVANANARLAADRLLPRLDPLADRRRWSPDRLRPAMTRFGPARFAVRSPSVRSTFYGKPYLRPVFNVSWESRTFADPIRVYICARRKIRRAVMFALGRGGGGKRKGRRNFYSDVRC